MPDVIPTIPNEPAQGIQATLDLLYLWNPDVANEFIEELEAMIAELDEIIDSLAPVATSGSYNDLTDKPAIDGVVLTSTTTKADIGLDAPMNYKGSVPTYADLPSDPDVGDVYNVIDSGVNYAWDGTNWDEFGTIVDLSPYRTAADQDVIDQAMQGDIDALESTVGRLGTAAYTDATAYATAAQGALADTALQPSALTPYRTSADQDVIDDAQDIAIADKASVIIRSW